MSIDKELDDSARLDDSPNASDGKIKAPKLKTLHTVGIVIAVVLVIAAVFLAFFLLRANDKAEGVHNRYDECANAASELMVASDYLTTECRMFVLTGDRSYMDAYFEELLVNKRRDAAVELLSAEVGDESAAAELISALAESNELAQLEFYGMRLMCEANGIEPMPEPVAMIDLSSEDEALSPMEKRARAQAMMLGDEYQRMKKLISQDVDDCATELVKGLEKRVLDFERTTDRLLIALVFIAFLLMALVLFTAISNYALVTRPMKTHEADLRAERKLTITGCYEIQRVSKAYNELYDKAQARTTFLRHEAETDALTGVLNRGSYDRILASQKGDFTLILIDIDHFKEINDRYGHEVGDEVLKRVASIIESRFRSSDHVCRIGGDEFAAILPKAGPANRDAIAAKLDALSTEVSSDAEGLPTITISIGIAFSSEANQTENLYHNADRALYASKHAGRNRYTFYGE